jgi:Uma2 family endonuclease
MAVPYRRMTLDEFLALPEEKPALEFEDGVVTQKVAPSGWHSRLQYTITERFNRYAEPRQLGSAFGELRTSYSGRSPVPDVAVYRWERIPLNAAGELAEHFLEPPDIAIEIVSPEQSIPSLVRKCRWYVDHGAAMALLVHPGHRTVRVFRHGATPLELRGADQIDFDDIIPGLQFSVDELFASLRYR